MSTEQERQRLREVAEGALGVGPVAMPASRLIALLDELAAVERERDVAMASEESIRLARYRVGREHRCPTCEHCEVMIHAEDQRDAALARAEAAEGVVARVRELAEEWRTRPGPRHQGLDLGVTLTARSAAHDILAVLSDPTPGMDPTSGDGVNGAPGRQSASESGTSRASDNGGIRAAVESIKRQAGDWTLDPDGGAGAPHRNERVTVVPAWEEA